MVDATFMRNRKKYNRPQGLLFSNNPGTIVAHSSGGYYAPEGYEFGSYNVTAEEYVEPDWMVLTDDNRKDIGLSFNRIEQRKRMINGRMRSVHVADKLKISCSWDMIPSRAFDMPQLQAVDSVTGLVTSETVPPGTTSDASGGLPSANSDSPPTYLRSWNVEPYRFTTDAGAGGADMLRWYKEHTGSFWVFLAYDNFHNFGTLADDNNPWAKLTRYNERVEVFFSDFQYNIVKRGQRYDFWNVSLSLEEA